MYATLKLSAVRYKTYANELAGIKLEFANGLETPLFETDFSRDTDPTLKLVRVDTSRTIRRISLKIDRRECLRGLRLIDRYGEDIVEIVWAKATSGRWITSQIPIG